MRAMQRTATTIEDGFAKKKNVVISDTKDLMASITGCSYSKEQKMILLDEVTKLIKESKEKLS